MKRKVDNWVTFTMLFYCADSTKTAATSTKFLLVPRGMYYIVNPKHETLSRGFNLTYKEKLRTWSTAADVHLNF